jgi:hypothetical protein
MSEGNRGFIHRRALALAAGVMVAGVVSSAHVAYASYVGNSMTAGSFDGASGVLFILGQYNYPNPTTTSTAADTFSSAGTVNDVDIYAPAAARSFVIYDMRPVSASATSATFTVAWGISLTTTAQSTAGPETLNVSAGHNVQAGDLLAYYAPGSGAAAFGGSQASGAAYDGQDAGYASSSGYAYGSQGVAALTVGANDTFQESTGTITNSTYFDYPTAYGPARIYSVGVDYTPTPEPASAGLVILGASAGLLRRRRKQR